MADAPPLSPFSPNDAERSSAVSPLPGAEPQATLPSDARTAPAEGLPEACPETAAGGKLRFDSLTDSVLIFLVLAALQRVVGFVRAVLFCRWMDPDQLGRWDMAFSFLMLAAPLSVISLSGSLGRYIEHYRCRGQLRALVRRIGAASALLALPAAGLIVVWREWFSRLIFGSPAHTHLALLIAVCLPVLVATHFFYDLLNGLRHARLLAVLQMCNGLLFTGLSLGLLAGWQPTADAVVGSYAVAAAACSLAALAWLARIWRSLPAELEPPPHGEFWARILPYVGWMVLVSLLVNLFQIVDRYMIVHFSGLSSQAALACVGQYHTSRVVPLLLVNVTLTLATMLTPHLSNDWEAGRRERLLRRLNLFVKLWGFVLVAAGWAVLLFAPLLFGVAFRGKFSEGYAVLPWTIIYCIWAAQTGVVGTYLLCAEKAGRSVPAMGLGLGVNVVLNLILLPPLGLLGAVLATTAANLVALVLTYLFSRQLGLRLDAGSLLVLGLPVVLCLGPWMAMLALALTAGAALRWNVLLSGEEKAQLADRWLDYRGRVGSWIAGGGNRSMR